MVRGRGVYKLGKLSLLYGKDEKWAFCGQYKIV